MGAGGSGFLNFGKGSGKETTSSPAADALAEIAKGFATESTPARTGLLSMMEEVLTTGGSGLRIPIIGRAIESSKQASSNTMKSLHEELARNNLAGTPFGLAIESQTRQKASQDAAAVSQSLSQLILNLIPNFILGQGQTATSGLAGAIPGSNTVSSTQSAFGTGTSAYGKYGK